MKHQFQALLIVTLAVVLTAMGACSSDDDTSTTTDTRQCALTTLTFGTLKRTMHTTSSTGADSTYTVSVTGSLYPISIDQVGGHVYNIDSLPVGTDVSRVVFSTASSTGVIAIRTLTTAIDSTFSATDSTDCSVPRQLIVYAYGGENTRSYTLDVRVHSEYADTFQWKNYGTEIAELQQFEATPRLVCRDDSVLVAYGTIDGAPTAVYGTAATGFTTAALPTGFDPTSVISTHNGAPYYALGSDALLTSTDGLTWQTVESDVHPDALLSAGKSQLEALKDGAFISNVIGTSTWTQDGADEAENIPTTNLAATVVPSRTDDDFEDVVLIGRKADGNVVVWRRNVDISGDDTYDWYCLPVVAGQTLTAPDLTTPVLSTYDGQTILTGQAADGTFAPIYVSQDNGRTWKTDVIKQLTLSTATSVATCVGQDSYIYVLDATNGTVYRGRHNRLGWNEEQTTYEKTRKK